MHSSTIIFVYVRVCIVLFMLLIPQPFCLSDDTSLWLYPVELYIYINKQK
jgi:hypothetical protein